MNQKDKAMVCHAVTIQKMIEDELKAMGLSDIKVDVKAKKLFYPVGRANWLWNAREDDKRSQKLIAICNLYDLQVEIVSD